MDRLCPICGEITTEDYCPGCDSLTAEFPDPATLQDYQYSGKFEE